MQQRQRFDLVLKGGRVIDTAQGVDGVQDVAISDGKIAAVATDLSGADEIVDARGALVLPGLIDTHAHVFRHVTGRFGLDADLVGVHSGVTALVDQGGPSLMTFPAFRSYVVEAAASRIYAFLSAYLVGGM
jgi:dihydroorotase